MTHVATIAVASQYFFDFLYIKRGYRCQYIEMKNLKINQKIYLIFIEGCTVFLTVFLSQMITTVFPAYPSVQSEKRNTSFSSSNTTTNCTIDDPSNIYVAILIGSKYSTELIMFPIVGWFTDKYHPPLILFYGTLIESVACAIYSTSGNFYVSILGRIIDAIGYSIVSTSGLTIIYTIFLNERTRNKIITIDSVMVYIAASVSPFYAGTVFKAASIISFDASRSFTFMAICPLFLLTSVALIPFAFPNSCILQSGCIGGNTMSDLEQEEKLDDCQSSDIMAYKIDVVTTELLKPACDDPDVNNTDISVKTHDDKSIKSDEDIPPKLETDSEVTIQKPISMIKLLKDPQVSVVLLCLLCDSLIQNSLETTLPIFMIRKFCSDQSNQGAVWLFGFLSTAGFGLSSLVFHMKPNICWLLPMIGMTFSGSMCVALFYCDPWWMIGVCLGIMNFFSSITEVILIPVIPKIIDFKYSKSYGSGSGLTLLTFTISGLIGTFPVGPLVEKFGFLTLCVILCISNYLMVPFIYTLKKYFK